MLVDEVIFGFWQSEKFPGWARSNSMLVLTRRAIHMLSALPKMKEDLQAIYPADTFRRGGSGREGGFFTCMQSVMLFDSEPSKNVIAQMAWIG